MRVQRGSLLTVAFATALISVTAGCGGSSELASGVDGPAPSPDIVATYAGQALTVSEFEQRYAKSVGGGDAASADSMAEYEDFLTRYVNFRLKVIDAIDSGVDRDSALVAELEQYRIQLARPYMVKKEVVDDLVDDLFEKQQLEVSASHILVVVQGDGTPADTLEAYEKIVMLRDSVLAGVDFNDLAERSSEDRSARRNRGSLGTFTGGRMILAFEEHAFNTPVGEMSDIFRTHYGYHLLLVHERGARSADISASHILIKVAADDTVTALEKVQEVQAALDAGGAFSDIASEYSDDPGSALKGGSLGSFGRGRMVPEFDDAAFSLEEVGDRSDWFRSQFGYHIIQLDENGKLPTYDESYDDMRATVQRLPRFKAAEKELGLQYRKSLGSEIDTLALDSLTVRFPEDSVLYFIALEEWDEDSRVMEIAQLGPEAFTVGDFLAYGKANRARRPTKYDRAQMYTLLDGMLDEKSLDVAASTLEERDSTFADLMNEYRDGIILFRVMEDSVWNKASGDSLGLAQHYEANSADYTFDERRRVVSFVARNDSLLGVVASSWTPGDTTAWSLLFENDKRFRVDTTFVADSTNSVYDRILDLPIGGTVGPITYRTGYVVLGVDGIEAPRGKTMDEARADVLSEYQTMVEDAWLGRLHNRLHARLFPENLVRVFSSSDANDDEAAGDANDDEADGDANGDEADGASY